MNFANREVAKRSSTRPTACKRGSSRSSDGTIRVLIAEDDSALRKSLEKTLVERGYSVVPARNGSEALDLIATAQVDLVILDLKMPEKDGWETFAKIMGHFPLLPVVIVTARPNQLFTALNHGASALFEKPLDIEAFLDTIQKLLSESLEERLKRSAGKESSFHYRKMRSSSHPTR